MLSSLLSCCLAGLLGAGRGEGSCVAPPFRAPAEEIKWSEGCPDWAACCTEYGYCQPRVSQNGLNMQAVFLDISRCLGRLSCSGTAMGRAMG